MSDAVPFSTPATHDKWEEVRTLNLEIATLKGTKETAMKAAKTAAQAADDAQTRADDLTALIATLEGQIGGLGADVRAFIGECRTILEGIAPVMAEAARTVKALVDQIDALTGDLGALEEKKKEVLASISRENELISVQRADLDVYHARIVAAAKIHLPEQQVVIPDQL